MSRTRLFAASFVALLIGVAACGSQPTPTAKPTSVVAAADEWLAARVDQPAAIEAAPSTAPAFCSPCHPSVGTYITSLVRVPAGYLALGYSFPPAQAAAWLSVDGHDWHRTPLPGSDGTEIVAATADAGGIVAVGVSGKSAAVWRSVDGTSWSLGQLPGGDGVAERATAVARVATGFVAGGYYETATAERHAVFWLSRNGTDWTKVAAPASQGADEITGIDVLAGTPVAIGIAGDPQTGTAAMWRSTTDGTVWQRVSSSSFAIGRPLGVTGTADGYVAVGERQDQTGAAVWTSSDGLSWQSISGQAALTNGGKKQVMTAVTYANGEIVAVGWETDAGNGSAAVWTSRDGRTWSHIPAQASFSGAGMAAVLLDTKIVAGGTIGWPDTHAAEVWVGPSP